MTTSPTGPDAAVFWVSNADLVEQTVRFAATGNSSVPLTRVLDTLLAGPTSQKSYRTNLSPGVSPPR